MHKICPKCKSLLVKKFWFKLWRQRRKCNNCGHVFERKRKAINKVKLYEEYGYQKQTYEELWNRYKVSWKTIKNHIDNVIIKKKILHPLIQY